MLHFIGLFCLLLACAVARPGHVHVERQLKQTANTTLPTLDLPYGSFRATSYSADTDIYTFKNIRFAAPPVGDLRFAAPAPPELNSTVSDGSYGPQCIQTSLNATYLGRTPVPLSLASFASLGSAGNIPQSEDCLFLDLYVPGKAVRDPSTNSLPIVFWIYGGALVFGSKDTYAGAGIVADSNNSVIYVAGNYRLGAYGFLAGTTMEQEGFPNAGLADQRAAIDWVYKYAPLFGGDKDTISLWGESAGAASIYSQLVWKGGARLPGVKRAILQSIAVTPYVDRRGYNEQVFQNYTRLAGCAGLGVACLRNASSSQLLAANNGIQQWAPLGEFALGVTADGKNIRQTPALEYLAGNFDKGIESLVVSHVADEDYIFTPTTLNTDSIFNAWIETLNPAYAKQDGVDAAIREFYTPVNGSTTSNGQFSSPYVFYDATNRSRVYLRDSIFTTNSRYLTSAYSGKTYNLQYSYPPGWHGLDIEPTFFDPTTEGNVTTAGEPPPAYAKAYQSYLISHALTGDPNTYAHGTEPPVIQWPHPTNVNGTWLENVLEVGTTGFDLILDSQNPRFASDFWSQVLSAETQAGGYVPPGAEVPQSIVPGLKDISRNYGNSEDVI